MELNQLVFSSGIRRKHTSQVRKILIPRSDITIINYHMQDCEKTDEPMRHSRPVSIANSHFSLSSEEKEIALTPQVNTP